MTAPRSGPETPDDVGRMWYQLPRNPADGAFGPAARDLSASRSTTFTGRWRIFSSGRTIEPKEDGEISAKVRIGRIWTR